MKSELRRPPAGARARGRAPRAGAGRRSGHVRRHGPRRARPAASRGRAGRWSRSDTRGDRPAPRRTVLLEAEQIAVEATRRIEVGYLEHQLGDAADRRRLRARAETTPAHVTLGLRSRSETRSRTAHPDGNARSPPYTDSGGPLGQDRHFRAPARTTSRASTSSCRATR